MYVRILTLFVGLWIASAVYSETEDSNITLDVEEDSAVTASEDYTEEVPAGNGSYNSSMEDVSSGSSEAEPMSIALPENEVTPAVLSAIKINAGLSYNFLRISKSSAYPVLETKEAFLNGAWHQTLSGYLNPQIDMGRLVINAGLGGQIGIDNITSTTTKWDMVHLQRSASLNSAGGMIKFGDLEKPFLNVSFGYLGYGYTKVKDFGGYLYTSGLHPMYLTSAGGNASLLGVLFQFNKPNQLHHDLIVNFETDWQPWMDLSLGYVATFNHEDKLDFGIGIKFHRLVPYANPDKGELNKTFVSTKIITETVKVTDSEGNEIDSVTNYIEMPYSGIKLMLRGCFDPLKTFDVSRGNFWGENDLRVYGEVGINDFSNYPVDVVRNIGYDDITNRMPVMAGINLPTHPLIGNLAVPLLASLALIAVEPDSIYFHGGTEFLRLDSLNKYYPEDMRGDSIVVDFAEDVEFKVKAKNEDGEDVIVSIYETGYRTITTNKRGFFRKDRLARPYLWIAGSLITGVGTYLLEKVVGEKLRLDEISLEVEYCKSPYNENVDGEGSGLPREVNILDQTYIPEINKNTQNFTHTSQVFSSTDWHLDDFRWALVFSKSFNNRFSVNGKIASDHFRQRDSWGFYSNIERLSAYYEWYWAMGINVGF